MSLLKEGDSVNFQKASCTLDGCVKIYTSRVDSVATETGKLLSGLADSSNTKKKGRGEDEEGEGSDEEEGDGDGEGRPKPKRRVCFALYRDCGIVVLLTSSDPTFLRSNPCEGLQPAANQKAGARILRRSAF